jgi:hypothetical protein
MRATIGQAPPSPYGGGNPLDRVQRRAEIRNEVVGVFDAD